MKNVKVIVPDNLFNPSEQKQIELMFTRVGLIFKRLLVNKLGQAKADEYNLIIDNTSGTVNLQSKVVTLTGSTQNISADAGYDGLATVTVPGAVLLSSIAVKAAPTKVTYSVGDTFDKTGLKCTATYSNGATRELLAADVTADTTTPLTAEDTTVTISFTEFGVTKTVTQAITVS